RDQIAVLLLVEQAVEHQADDLVAGSVAAEHGVQRAYVAEVPFDDVSALLGRDAVVGVCARGARGQELGTACQERHVGGRATGPLQEVPAGPLLQEPFELLEPRTVGILFSAHLYLPKAPPLWLRAGAVKPKPMIMSSCGYWSKTHFNDLQRGAGRGARCPASA